MKPEIKGLICSILCVRFLEKKALSIVVAARFSCQLCDLPDVRKLVLSW
jgi:hypothetical protein